MIKIEHEEVHGWSEAINGHPEFRATKDGQIIGKRGKPLVGHIDRCGYKEVLLSENGKTKNYLAHRLILSTFMPVVGMEKNDVNHKADMFGVDRTTIHDIVNQKTWRGIE